MSFISPLDRDLALVYPRIAPVRLMELLAERGITIVEVPDAEFATRARTCSPSALAARSRSQATPRPTAHGARGCRRRHVPGRRDLAARATAARPASPAPIAAHRGTQAACRVARASRASSSVSCADESLAPRRRRRRAAARRGGRGAHGRAGGRRGRRSGSSSSIGARSVVERLRIEKSA